ncbi:MAG: galactose oxidase-like domain-containing protein, partial [Planctomycetota bacterium]
VFQPWSIVNPYWPANNPNFWPGMPAVQHRFHNATLAMPLLVGGPTPVPPWPVRPIGELFCAGQTWMADGRLLVAGGTRQYPIQSNGWFVGAKFVYQWDPLPQTGDPFGRWWQMADLEVDRWYPTVTYDGTSSHRGIVIGGTSWTPQYGTQDVNSYEVVRIAYNAQPAPLLLAPPNDFDRKPAPGTQPNWPVGVPIPALSDRQYWGPFVPPIAPAAPPTPAFGDYPRVHALGYLDPISTGTAPRLFVSGFNGWGMRWAHDRFGDPAFGSSLGSIGFDIGQFPANNDSAVRYATSLLLPASIGGISTQVARIGGFRGPITGNASDLVETANVSTPGSSWLSGAGSIPAMNHRRLLGNVVILPTGELFAVGGQNVGALSNPPNPANDFNLIPELLVGGTTWTDMAPHVGPRDYHSAAILLPTAQVLVCGGENRKNPGLPAGKDYIIWDPPYFHLDYGSVPLAGITVSNNATGAVVPQDTINPALGLQYGQTYRATWTNALEPGIEVNSVVLMRPEALTHHDDGGQRMVRCLAWHDEDANSGPFGSVLFKSPTSERHAPPGWWMLFLVTSAGRPSLAYWVHLV